MNIQKIGWLGLRLGMGFIFLWAFLDKTFGLGFATVAEKSWMNGGSPTYGFLTMVTKGPFAEFFQSLAGVQVVDWLFMAGFFFFCLSFLLNQYLKWCSLAGFSFV